VIIEIDKSNLKSKINNSFKDYFDKYDNYYEIYYGGSGSGKSHFIVRKMLFKLLKSKRRLLVVRKFYTTHKDSTYTLFKEIIEKWGLLQHSSVTVSPLYIRLPNKSEIIFKGFDDEEKIKSLENISDVWIEEANELLKNDFDQLGLRMRGTGEKQQIYISFNPISDSHWLHDRFFKMKEEKALIHKSTYLDNRFLPQSYIEKLQELKETNPRYYNIYALGNWGTFEGVVFSNYVIEDNLEMQCKNYDWHRIGADWGYNDPTAIIHCAIHDDELYIYKQYYKKQKTKDEISDEIQNDGIKIIADSAEPATIEYFRRRKFNIHSAKKGKNSITDGLNTMRNFKKIHVDSKCVDVIRELQNYTYRFDKKTSKYLDEPIDDFNHSIDAIRYALEDYTYKKNTKATFSKNPF
jgi:phage terminase large subunit